MRIGWAAVLLATGLLVAGCGSSTGGGGGSTSAPAPSPATSAPSTPSTSASSSPASAELCADVAALQASVNQLLTITVSRGAATELQNDLKDVQSSLATLVDGARAEWQDEVAALQASVTTLRSALQQLASSPSTATVAAARTALQGVGTAAGNLYAAATVSCPSLSPSPTS